MEMKKPFDLLAEFGKFGLEQKISLRDPATCAAFVHHVSSEVKRALDDKALLHGQRAEAMFEALLVSLGRFKLLKAEDSGRLFPASRYRAPDFRVVLNDGKHWLIEVKNVYEKEAFQQHRQLLTKSYHMKLADYAKTTGAELKLAIYWARWSIWTLVSPDRLIGPDGGLKLEMETALLVNELSSLGDQMIGTRPPLRIRLSMDPARTSAISSDGHVRATIGAVQMFCGPEELTDPDDMELAWVFMRFGEWEEDRPEAITDGNHLQAIEFRWLPKEPTNQGFEIIGSLSGMFSRYYAKHTIDEGGVMQLRAPLRPNWFESLHNKKHDCRTLPLWQFYIEPNYDLLELW
ncbi:MAG: hypothetical protein OXI81_08900 [Paracoccaceae bacterium]|nr:hypothetical protein [Paracoccaceae bacterium]